MKKKIYISLFIASLLVYTSYGQGPPPPPPPPGLVLPIDGGLLFLFLSGIILGIKKLEE
jgi:hypothetical protein